MNREYWKNWLEGIGIVAIVASLIFVGLQLRQADDIAFAELSEATAMRGIEMSALIADHADVWRKACLGEELSSAEHIIAANIFFRYQQGNFNAWTRYRATGMGPSDSGFLIDSFAANIHRYPAFREMAQSWLDWSSQDTRFHGVYIREYLNAIRNRVQELQLEEPNPDADVRWCGIR